jgi:hypothetical protein
MTAGVKLNRLIGDERPEVIDYNAVAELTGFAPIVVGMPYLITVQTIGIVSFCTRQSVNRTVFP